MFVKYQKLRDSPYKGFIPKATTIRVYLQC